MGTYIRTIEWSNGAAVDLAYPVEEGAGGTINVICGPNNAGKSYLLKQLRKKLEKTFEPVNDGRPHSLRLSFTDARQPYVVSFDESSRFKSKVGIVYVGFKKVRIATSQNVPAYRRIPLLFLLQNLNAHSRDEETVEHGAHVDYPELRAQAAEHFVPHQLYICARTSPIVQQLERILGGTLYFRRSAREEAGLHFEFVLVYGDRRAVGYEDWSEGQQESFYLITHIALGKPEIVLLDEIENHLHPAYITKLLEFLRLEPRQSIITTHHPHVIFSERVDRVIYLDKPQAPCLEEPASIVAQPEINTRDWPQPQVVTLEDGFERITHAYKLFDLQDNQLLRQAARITGAADIEIFRILHTIYASDVKSVTSRVFPDKQSMELVERIHSFVAEAPENKVVSILDLGAGFGRIAAEVSKLSQWQHHAHIHWTCWEPNSANRLQLRETLEQHNVVAEVPTSTHVIRDGSQEIALIANVLHELTPEEFATVIQLAERKTQPQSGSIIILELHPLLHAEKYAVPYPPSVLQGILNDCGFTTDCETIPVGGGITTAYCLLCRKANVGTESDGKNIRRIVEEAWKRLQRDAVSAYANRRTIGSFTQYRSLVQEMTVIASVAAWKQGYWVPKATEE